MGRAPSSGSHNNRNQQKKRQPAGSMATKLRNKNIKDSQGEVTRKPHTLSRGFNKQGINHLSNEVDKPSPGTGPLYWIYKDPSKNEQPSNNAKTAETTVKSAGNTLQAPEASDKAPWLKIRGASSLSEQLNNEILDFVEFASPTMRESTSREKLLNRVTDTLHDIFPNCRVTVFGSFPMGLFLPGADLDLVIHGLDDREVKRSLHRLGGLLRRQTWISKVEVIARARVPIVKFTDTATGLQVDLCFNQDSGANALRIARTWLVENPEIRPLAMVIKLFLKQKNFSTVQFGGLGGFATICMVVSMLRNQQEILNKEIDPMQNIGVLLLKFFELYGTQIGDKRTRLSMNGNMSRSSVGMMDHEGGCSLEVEDPANPDNVMTKGSHRYASIVKEFQRALRDLDARCRILAQMPEEQRIRRSLLSCIIRSNGLFRHGDPNSSDYEPFKYELKDIASYMNLRRVSNKDRYGSRPQVSDRSPKRTKPDPKQAAKPRSSNSNNSNTVRPPKSVKQQKRSAPHPLMPTIDVSATR